MTIAELRDKLKLRATGEEDIQNVLGRLKEMRALNDRQFADSYAATRRDGAGHGKARVLRDLASRKVPRLVAENAVAEAYQDVDETDHAVAFLRRKVRTSDPEVYFADPKNLQSAFRKLRYNGFSVNAAMKALRQYSTSAAELEDLPEDE